MATLKLQAECPSGARSGLVGGTERAGARTSLAVLSLTSPSWLVLPLSHAVFSMTSPSWMALPFSRAALSILTALPVGRPSCGDVGALRGKGAEES